MMRRARPASNLSLWLLGLAPLLLLSGCHFIGGPHGGRQDTWYFCDPTGCYLCSEQGCELPTWTCTSETGCPHNMHCDWSTGICRSNTSCRTSSECGSGLICQDGACVPGTLPCTSDASCGDGAYCSNGTCKESSRCQNDTDCSTYFTNLVCDQRGTCVPAPEVAPCQTASACADGLCLDGTCATCSGDCGGGTTCQFNNHCGAGRVCLDGQCTSSCSKPEDCGSGQTCKSSVCVADSNNGPGDPSPFCLKDTDCAGGKLCLNNSCYSPCTGTCASPKDSCSAPIAVASGSVRLCLPDHSAKLECQLTKDCTGGEQCVNGICRTVCNQDTDCAVCPDGPVCGKGGFCMTAIENAPVCATNAQCSTGSVCLNGDCSKL